MCPATAVWSPVVLPGPSPRPYGGWFDEAADTLEQTLGDDYANAVEKVVVEFGELTFHVRREALQGFVQTLRDHPDLRFETCLGVSGVNWPGDSDRELHAVYHFRSMTHAGRMVRVETTCPDADPHVPTITGIYPANDWHERETYDMFGIIFDGHHGLTRILMPDDWVGHPQRKDYPLGRNPCGVQGCQHPRPGRAQGVLLMSETYSRHDTASAAATDQEVLDEEQAHAVHEKK